MPNTLRKLLKKYPDKPWDYYWLSSNENLTIDIVIRDLNKTSNNKTRSVWYWNGLIQNKNINREELLKIAEQYITIKDCQDLDYFKKYNSITINNIDEYIQKNGPVSSHVSSRGETWEWPNISYLANVSLKDILSRPDLPWYWRHVLYNKNITVKDILDNPNLPWPSIKDNVMSQKLSLTLKDILEHPEINWWFLFLSRHIKLTINDVRNNKELMSDWWLAENPSFTIKDIQNNPDLFLNKTKKFILGNPNITLSYIENNLEDINWSLLSWNPFHMDRYERYLMVLSKIIISDLADIIINYAISAHDYSKEPVADCFSEETKIMLWDGSFLRASLIKKGQKLYGNAKVLCVVIEKRDHMFLKISKDTYITPWHPIKVIKSPIGLSRTIDQKRWMFPNEIFNKTVIKDVAYNFVLDSYHKVHLDNNSYEALTLGHGVVESDIAKHDFFGTSLVIDCLKTFEGYDKGLVYINGAIRDPVSNRVIGFL